MPPEALEFFFDRRALLIPGELFGQFGVTTGQLLEAGVSLDGLGDELQLLVADALAVVGAVFVPLKDVVGAIGGSA